jgi:hypothetical protein
MPDLAICPKCKTGVMGARDDVFTLPALTDNKFANQLPVSDGIGMRLRTSVCPKCRYVEFFVATM